MARNLCRGLARIAIAVLSALVVLLWPSAWAKIAVIAYGAVLGLLLFKPAQSAAHDSLPISVSRRSGILLLALFIGLLGGLPLAAQVWQGQTLAVVIDFYRAGALVFGGGHVVLPLLQAAVVPSGLVANETFLAGYGAAQAVPGPIFTFAAFLGASSSLPINPWLGAAICLAAIFLPSFLLLAGALPFWEPLRRSVRAQATLAGVNAGVVGLLAAALYKPVWVSAIFSPMDFVLAALALAALMFWKLPPWLVVLGCGLAGWILTLAS